MNKNRLMGIMKLNEDTSEELAKYLGIARSTLSSKMNEYRGMEFTQGEIKKIKERYKLDAEEIELIFFAQKES